ncbi:Hypp8478 [Branchiostoma lanceolatum]|uniref:Hypp8478 protein n=1 Tax=Branchiostoma lanceolatum TaxID=7740 RepID=A0A8J9Z8H7_BRALA|nr:Hypp8478 [Branchiostoma lanceolatum]
MVIFEGDDVPSDREIEQQTQELIDNGDFVSNISGFSVKEDSFKSIQPTDEEIAQVQTGLCSPGCGEHGVCNVTTVYGVLVAKCMCNGTYNYCYNNGHCDFDEGPTCRCDDDPTGFYMGDRCNFYASQPLVIGVGAGAGGLLLIIIITLSICLCCRRKKKGGDYERSLPIDNSYWSPDEKLPMTKQTDDIPDEMPLYSMVNKRQKYSDDSSDSEKNNLTRASRLSSQDRGSYVMPTRERPANNSYGNGNLQTFGGRDNRAFDWKPTVKNVPTHQEYKLPRARLSTSNNQW